MNEKERLLLLTQDLRLVERCKAALEDGNRHVVEVRDPGMLRPLLARGADLAIVDLGLPAKSLEESAAVLGGRRDLPVLVLSSSSPAEWHLVSRGNPLEQVLDAAAPDQELVSQVERLLEKSRFLRGATLVGRSEAMQELRERILLIAPTPVTVLLTGETGTGKEEAALGVHHYSTRRGHPFKPINCAAIPENLLENELFGHEKGAFTDAKGQYRGIFEQGEGGTVFLDEIGEMSLSAQVRLLRVLEQREITRIGGTAPIPVDTRIIAATNKDLQQAVEQGAFRRDLYHRLKVVELHLPALRRRQEDLPRLIEHFVAALGHEQHSRFAGFSPAALDLLARYDWPGNVRELRNLIEHFFYLGPRGQVEPADLLPHLEGTPSVARLLPVATNKPPDQSERELVYFALLDLKREVAQLRDLVEERLPEALGAPARPIYPVEESRFARRETETAEPVEAPAAEVRTLQALQREAIETALALVGGNRRLAAEKLGIGVRTLYRKLQGYGLR